MSVVQNGRVDINHIKIGDRHRKDLGDIGALADSIREVGLLHPIVVDSGLKLVVGHRRLEACRKLGWPTVPIRTVRQINDAVAAVKAERDENTCRKDMKASELYSLGKVIESMERPKAHQAMSEGGSKGATTRWDGPSEDGVGSIDPTPSDREANKTNTKVGAAIGASGPQWQRLKHMGDRAATGDEAAREALDQVDAGQASLSGAYRELRETDRGETTSSRIAKAKEKNPLPGTPTARVALAKDLAAAGHTSRQIAEAIGIGFKSMHGFRNRHGIEVPADAIVGRHRRRIDPNRIVAETALTLTSLTNGLDVMDLTGLDVARLGEWAISLNDSLTKLRSFTNRLKEMTRA